MPPVWLALLAASLLTADPPPPLAAREAAGVESYEDALVRWDLERRGLLLEPEPEGKPLASVEVVAEDVVASTDPYPSLLNVFHARTREHVIRREVLLEEGLPYSSALALETARNLRRLGIFAVVRVVAVRGPAPDTVSLLVVTKDLWSLRLNQDIQLVGPLIQALRLQATEQNFLGLNKKVALDFLLRRDALTLGQTYVDPRLGGSRWSLTESAALILARSGTPEGSKGSVLLSRPLFSLSTPWSFQVQGAWRVQPVRVFRGADVWQLPFAGGTVPYVYDAEELSGSSLYLRSWGSRFKLDAGGGVGAYHRRYEAPRDTGLDEDQRTWLRDTLLPRSENATYVLAYARLWDTRYEVMRDVDSYALSEDFQVGHYLTATARYAPALLASASTFAEVGLTARYRVRLGDALTTLALAGSVRQWLGGEARGQWTNRRAAGELQQVSPKVLGGRFVARALVDFNRDDLNERVLLLGGGNGLRGAPPEAYSGRRLLLLNVEYRTRPLVVHTVHLGGVLFYDAGSAFDTQPGVVHSVGVGLRLLFPQFNTFPFRLDLGYVLNGDRPPVSGRFSFSGGQVTEFRPAFLDSPL